MTCWVHVPKYLSEDNKQLHVADEFVQMAYHPF